MDDNGPITCLFNLALLFISKDECVFIEQLDISVLFLWIIYSFLLYKGYKITIMIFYFFCVPHII